MWAFESGVREPASKVDHGTKGALLMSDSKHLVCPHCGKINRVASARLGEAPVCGSCKQQLFTGRPVPLSEASFQRFVERSDLPVVDDFWASWCGPCKMMAPAYEQAAAQLEPQAILAKLNTEEAPRLSAGYGIQSIPTLVVFQQGQETARQPGAMALPQIVQWVQAHI